MNGEPLPNQRLPRVLAIVPSMTPSPVIYVTKPLSALAAKGHIVFDAASEAEVPVEKIQWSDVVVYCRNCEPVFNDKLHYALGAGKKVVYDLDDNFWVIPATSKDSPYHSAPERIAQLEEYVKTADLVRVYNSRLLQKVWQLTQRVVQIQPCIDLNLTPKRIVRREKNQLRIVYVTMRGASDEFFAVFGPDLLRILDEYKGRVDSYFWGGAPDIMIQHPNTHILPWVYEYEQFLWELSHSGFDIGLAPLTDNEFTLSKTNTKFRDYGGSHIAGIYTNLPIYADWVRHGETGMLVDQAPGAWYEAMKALIDDPGMRQGIQENAYNTVDQYFRQELAEAEWLRELDCLLPWYRVDAIPPQPNQPIHYSAAIEQVNSPGTMVGLGGDHFETNPGIWIDRKLQMGVDILVKDYDHLPLAASSVDLLAAEHVLEYCQDLMQVLREIYRVCRHGAQVCFVVPYFSRGLNLVNPHHQNYFNEYSLLYWTDFQPEDVGIPAHEHISMWNLGLSRVDYANPGIDFRCARIEYLYLPPYRALSIAEKEAARQKYLDVCDQMIIHLVVIKEPVGSEEVNTMIKRWEFFEPPSVTARRYKDLYEVTQEAYQRLRTDIQALKEIERPTVEAGQALVVEKRNGQATPFSSGVLDTDMRELALSLEKDRAGHVVGKQELEDQRAAVLQKIIELEEQKNLVQRKIVELEEVREASQKKSLELEKLRAMVDNLNGYLDTARQYITKIEKRLEEQKNSLHRMAAELDAFRNRKTIRLIRRFFDHSNAWHDIRPEFQQLQDDSLMFNADLRGYHLQPSENLAQVDFIGYPLQLTQPDLNRVLLAVILDMIPDSGAIGIEIVSPQNQIIAREAVPIQTVDPNKPLLFAFPPIPNSNEGLFWLRVFVREVDAPVRVFEWRKHQLRGFGPLRRKPFCGFGFA